LHIAYERIASDIAHSVRLGIVSGLGPKDLIKRVRKSFPTSRKVRYGRRALAKPIIREANVTQKAVIQAIDQDFYDQSEWDQILDLYHDTLDPGRFNPDDMEEEGVDRYRFEFEQEATEEFVAQVRDGEIAAANDQGIDDFVWTAVLDKKTCEECCAKRDGLLTSEIEAKLNDDWKDDDCQAVTPPGHPFCRCQVLPVASNLVPSKEQISYSGIDEWLNSP
jgi:hypothetical protein